MKVGLHLHRIFFCPGIIYHSQPSIKFFAGAELHIWGLQYDQILPGLPYQGTDERKEDQLTAELEPLWGSHIMNDNANTSFKSSIMLTKYTL